MSDSLERWKPFPGDPRYLVSTLGRVKGLKGQLLRPQASGNARQYRKVRTAYSQNTRVDHMVLEAFVGPRPDGMECCHANDIQSDNRLSNLRWATHVENCRDRTRNGSLDTHYQSIRKVSPQEIQELRRRGLTFRRIGALLGVQASTVYRNTR